MKRQITLIMAFIFLLLSLCCKAQDLKQYEAAISKALSAWRDHFPDFNLSYFELGAAYDIDFSETKQQKGTIGNLSTYYSKYKDFFFISPDKAYFIDLLYGGIDIEKRDGKYYGSRDVDHVIFLGQFAAKNAGILVQIGFCGSACEYSDAYWLDNKNALILGNYNESNNYLPTIAWVNLADKKVYHYYCTNDKLASKSMYQGKLFKKIIFE